MTEPQVLDRPPAEGAQKVTLVDCDIHPLPASPGELMAYLPEKWRSHLARFGTRWQLAQYPKVGGFAVRADAWPEEGLPGSSVELMRTQHLDQYGVDYGMLNFDHDERGHRELAVEFARAINDWVAEKWLAAEPRLLGSIVVPWEHPELAVREIERRVAEGRQWVQVAHPLEGAEPLGSRKYRPIYEAAAAHGLPVRMHVGQYGLHNGTGWPSYYFEEHVDAALATRAQLLNMVCEGLFDAVPGVKIVLVEGGVTWATSLRWALDSAFEQFGAETGLPRRPSEYLDESVWYTTQPIEEPDDPRDLARLIEHGRLESRLLFSTDYPHWDFDAPTQSLPRSLPKETRERIFAGNACELYGLPR
ncbi:amidohydrolase family protein [Nonomuraea sp. NPDC005650]|uniref:amidohydrolase family protein n=1 Tax=Nonomuraea sp. NPDC005650 TaxID=3157045 RepID=UPI0033BC8219